jgi:ubiquitin carboxyl-terminal hydrolase 36/42
MYVTSLYTRFSGPHTFQPWTGSVKSGFCMSCAMRELMISCYKSKRAVVPYVITSKLQRTRYFDIRVALRLIYCVPEIAKHMRKGRQEDSHEFLRYAIDALQKSCLAGHPP